MAEKTTTIVDHDTALLWLNSADGNPHSREYLFPIMFEKLPAGETLTPQQICDRMVESFRWYLASRQFKPEVARKMRIVLDQLFPHYLIAFLDEPIEFVQEVEQHYIRCRGNFLRSG